MKQLTILFLFIATLSSSQTLIKLKQIEKAAGTGSTVTTSSVGVLAFVPEQTLTVSGQSLSITRGNTVTIPSATLTAGNGISLTSSGSSYTINAQPIYAINSGTVATSSTVSATTSLSVTLPVGVFEITGLLSVQTSSNGGVKWNCIQYPTSVPSSNPTMLVRGLNASSTTISNQPLTSSLSSNAIMTVASTAPMTIQGIFNSTGGVFELGFAAGANGTTVSLLPNSTIIFRRIQ